MNDVLVVHGFSIVYKADFTGSAHFPSFVPLPFVLTSSHGHINVTVITGDEGSFKPETWQKIKAALELLQNHHVKLICTPKVYQRYAVIDQQLVWYGGINFLGFEKAVQGAMRLNSPELAKELTDSN